MILFGSINGYNYNYMPSIYASDKVLADFSPNEGTLAFDDDTIAIYEDGKVVSRKSGVGILPTQFEIKPVASYAIFAKKWNKGSIYEAWFPVDQVDHFFLHYYYNNSTMTSECSLAIKINNGYVDITDIRKQENDIDFDSNIFGIALAKNEDNFVVRLLNANDATLLAMEFTNYEENMEMAAKKALEVDPITAQAIENYGVANAVAAMALLQEQPFNYETKKPILDAYVNNLTE